MDPDATWYEGRSWPRPHCGTWDPSPPKKMAGAQPPPQFLAHIYCGQTVVLSAVAELLLLYLQLTVINNFTLFVLPLTNV